MLKNAFLYALALTALTGLAACDNDPGQGKPLATVAEPADMPADDQAAASDSQSQRLVFDQDGSQIGFVGAKVTNKHEGSFKVFSGTVELVDGDPTKSSVEVEIDNASLVADEEKLTNHLKSPDFFDVENIPKSSFSSTAIKAGGTDGASHTVTGNLTLHGVTKAVTFPATITVEGGKADVDAEFVINRKDFGITYPGMPDDLIKDEVLIKLDINAKPAS